jgi:hypothetical protein
VKKQRIDFGVDGSVTDFLALTMPILWAGPFQLQFTGLCPKFAELLRLSRNTNGCDRTITNRHRAIQKHAGSLTRFCLVISLLFTSSLFNEAQTTPSFNKQIYASRSTEQTSFGFSKAADLNNDGIPDLLLCCDPNKQAWFQLSSTLGGFQAPNTLGPGGSLSKAVTSMKTAGTMSQKSTSCTA